MGELEHQPVLGGALHPAAGLRDQLADPEQPVVAHLQRVKAARDGAEPAAGLWFFRLGGVLDLWVSVRRSHYIPLVSTRGAGPAGRSALQQARRGSAAPA